MTINIQALCLGVEEVAMILRQMRESDDINAQDFHEKVTSNLKSLAYLADDFEFELTHPRVQA